MEIFIITLSITLCVYLGVYWFAKHDEKKFTATLQDIKPVEPTTVTCEDCGCEIKEENACKVKYLLSNTYLYFCRGCKPNYDRISLGYDGDRIYYKELEVTKDGEPVYKQLEVPEDGEPVGYKKK